MEHLSNYNLSYFKRVFPKDHGERCLRPPSFTCYLIGELKHKHSARVLYVLVCPAQNNNVKRPNSRFHQVREHFNFSFSIAVPCNLESETSASLRKLNKFEKSQSLRPYWMTFTNNLNKISPEEGSITFCGQTKFCNKRLLEQSATFIVLG